MEKIKIKTCSCFFDIEMKYLKSDEPPPLLECELDCLRLRKKKIVLLDTVDQNDGSTYNLLLCQEFQYSPLADF